MGVKDDEYISEVVERYINLRQRGLIVSPRDWEILTFWITREIPLRIIMKAMDVAYSDFDEERARIRTLAYVKRIVWRLERERKMALVGLPTNIDIPETDEERLILKEGFNKLTGKIENLVEREDEFREVYSRTLNNILKLQKDIFSGTTDIGDCLNRLAKIEDGLLTSIFNRLPDNMIDSLEKTADKKLKRYEDNMEEESYVKTRRAFIKHLIRLDMKIPQIDPFT